MYDIVLGVKLSKEVGRSWHALPSVLTGTYTCQLKVINYAIM